MKITEVKRQLVMRLLFCLVLMFPAVDMEDQSEYRCFRYKRYLYDEVKTISYFHAGAKEVSYTEDHCKSIGGFVVGGENALPKEFPFAARLGHFESANGRISIAWLCGGTLISNTVVLTAAHCFYSSHGTVNRVRLGELDFDSVTDDADPEDFNVQQLIEHPDYRYHLPYNDIGLIILASAVIFNGYKHPACLPPISVTAEDQNNLIAIGWGRMTYTGQLSQHLQKVFLQPYTYSKCVWLAEGPEGIERLPFGLRSSQLCAGSRQEKDTCHGDSGGPLLMQHPKYPCMQIVVGITSTGVGGCGTSNIPALYTRIKNYLNWIYYYIG